MQESHEPKEVRVLEYSAPPLFFAGSYRYGTTWILVGSIVALVFAGGFAVAAVVALSEFKTTPSAAVAAIVCGVASALTFAVVDHLSMAHPSRDHAAHHRGRRRILGPTLAVAANRANRRVPCRQRRLSYDQAGRCLPRAAVSADDTAPHTPAVRVPHAVVAGLSSLALSERHNRNRTARERGLKTPLSSSRRAATVAQMANSRRLELYQWPGPISISGNTASGKLTILPSGKVFS